MKWQLPWAVFIVAFVLVFFFIFKDEFMKTGIGLKFRELISSNYRNLSPEQLESERLVVEGQEDWEKAAKIYKLKIQKDPNNPDLWKSLSDIENRLKNYSEAAKSLKEVIRISPKISLYIALSEIYAISDKPNEAAQSIEDALKLEPYNIELLNRRALLARWVKDFDKAIDCYKKILQIEPTNKDAEFNLTYTEDQKKLAKENKLYDPELYEGLSAEKNGKWEEAISIYKEKLATKPNNPELWKRVADIQNHLQQYKNAVTSLNEAVKYQPENTKLYVSLYETYSVANQPENALQAIEKALQLEPNNIDLLKNRAALAVWVNDFDRAIESYKKILKIDPINMDAALSLRKIEKQKGIAKKNKIDDPALYEGLSAENNEKWEEAITLYKKNLENKPNNPDLWKRVGDIQNHLKQYSEAANSFKEAIKYQPKDISLYVSLYETYSVANDPDNALKAIEKALSFEPNNIELLRNRATLAVWANDFDKAIESYQKILKIEPQDRDSAFNLKNVEKQKERFANTKIDPVLNEGIGAETKGKWEDAISIYKKNLAEKPNNPDLWKRVSDIQNHLKQYSDAANSLSEAIKYQPKDMNLYVSLAEIYAASNNPENALKVIDKGLKFEPNNIEILERRAELANWAKNLDVAIESYQKILKLDPTNKNAKDSIRSLEKQQKDLAKVPEIGVYIPFEGLEAENQEDFEKALSIYKAAISKNPKNYALWQRIYNVEYKLKRLPEAIESIKQAIKIYPKDATLYEDLSSVYSETNMPKEALAAIEKALEIEPDNITYLKSKAFHAEWLNDLGKREEAYNSILAIDPKDKEALMGILKIRTEREAQKNIPTSLLPEDGQAAEEKKDFSKALKIYRAAVSRDPKNIAVWQRIYNIELMLKQYPESIASIKKVIKLTPNDAKLYADLSSVYAEANMPKEAMSAIEQALQLEPENLTYLKSRATLADWLNDFNKMEDSYNRILKIEPENKEALMGILNVRQQRKDYNDSLKKALSIEE